MVAWMAASVAGAADFAALRSTNEMASRRVAIIAAMQEVMGLLPGPEKRCALAMRVEQEEDGGTFVRRLISYESEPGSRVPAYLLVPKKAGSLTNRFPGVLALHQTHALGYKVVVGLGKSTNDEYGVELAQRGYVVLAPSYPLLANYQPNLKQLGYVSGTMKAIWDNIRGLDLLDSLPYAGHGSYAAIGHSLGGHNSLYTAAFDERIKVIVSSCGFDSFRDYKDGNITGWTSERYMPRLKNYRLDSLPFDFAEVIAAIAPRALFVNAPLGDTNFKWRSVDEVIKAAMPAYQLYGKTNAVHVEHPSCGHLFPADLRLAAYGMIDDGLKPKK